MPAIVSALERLPNDVDDITLLTRDVEKLKQAIIVLEPYLELTQQKLNVSKTDTFAVRSDAANTPL